METKLQHAQALLKEHMLSSLPEKKQHVRDIDVRQVDASICNLVANLIRFEGDLTAVNEYYKKAGSPKDFNTMILAAQGMLDVVLSALDDGESRDYFARLSKMSVIAAEIGITKAAEGVVSDAAKDEEVSESLRITADLSEGLEAFRAMMGYQKAQEN